VVRVCSFLHRTPVRETSLLLCTKELLHSLASANDVAALEVQFKQEFERKEDIREVSSMKENT